MKTVTKTLLIGISAIAMTGCGLLNGLTVNISDQDLQKKAAMTIGVDANDVNITNRETDGHQINFKATTKGKQYACYITTAMGLYGNAAVSSALCQPMQSNSSQQDNTPSCNALLMAAGKCK